MLEIRLRSRDSIANIYIIEEEFKFCMHYFKTNIYVKMQRVPKNYCGRNIKKTERNLSIFTHPGWPYGYPQEHFLTNRKYKAMIIYILIDSIEIKPY